MEEIKTSAFMSTEEEPLTSQYNFGNEKPLLDMEGFETLESSKNINELDTDLTKNPIDDTIGNFQSGLVSTTRPLVTSNDEDITESSKSISPTQTTSNLPDFTNVDKSSSLIGSSADTKVEDSYRDSVSELQRSSGDRLLIDVDEQHGDDSDLLISSTKDRGNTPVSFDKVHESEVVETLPKVEDLKIGTKPKADTDNYQSGIRAYEPAAQPAVKSEVAMESETVGNASKTSEAECPFSPGAWFNPEKLHPVVAEYIYWRDPKKSGIVFGATLVLLLSLKYFSFISVAAYLTLALLFVTISFRIYKNILQAVQKSNEGHPFKEYLEVDITLSQDKVSETVETLIHHVNCVTGKLRSLVLVEDLFDTLKLLVLAWCMTYVGAWFNGLTLIIIAFVSVFTLPKVYETNKAQIDVYAELVRTKGKEMIEMVNAKMPLGKKKK
ncbi:Reticulon-4, partial [Stegodyphus mimosarum]